MANSTRSPFQGSGPSSAQIGAVALAVVTALGVGVVSFQGPPGPAEEPVIGAVLQARTGATTTAPDLDHDGTPNARDADRDNDGWLDIDDPKPDSGVYVTGKWYANIDNDAIVDYRKDQDDDNDGLLDAKDRYPNDMNNNGSPDPKERREKGQQYDGDNDKKGDLAELRKVALAQAEKLGITISHTVQHLADIPPGVFKELPEGWSAICQDSDNDGLPNAIDKFDRSFGGSYANYVSGGTWENSWDRHGGDWQKYGYVDPDRHGVPGILGEPPRYEFPKEWASGYIPGVGFTTTSTTTTGGTVTTTYDPYAHFYGSVPTAEQQHYETTTYTPTGGTTSTSGGTTYTPPTTTEGTSGTAPPPAPPPTTEGYHYESVPPPPPPPPPPPS